MIRRNMHLIIAIWLLLFSWGTNASSGAFQEAENTEPPVLVLPDTEKPEPKKPPFGPPPKRPPKTPKKVKPASPPEDQPKKSDESDSNPDHNPNPRNVGGDFIFGWNEESIEKKRFLRNFKWTETTSYVAAKGKGPFDCYIFPFLGFSNKSGQDVANLLQLHASGSDGAGKNAGVIWFDGIGQGQLIVRSEKVANELAINFGNGQFNRGIHLAQSESDKPNGATVKATRYQFIAWDSELPMVNVNWVNADQPLFAPHFNLVYYHHQQLLQSGLLGANGAGWLGQFDQEWKLRPVNAHQPLLKVLVAKQGEELIPVGVTLNRSAEFKGEKIYDIFLSNQKKLRTLSYFSNWPPPTEKGWTGKFHLLQQQPSSLIGRTPEYPFWLFANAEYTHGGKKYEYSYLYPPFGAALANKPADLQNLLLDPDLVQRHSEYFFGLAKDAEPNDPLNVRLDELPGGKKSLSGLFKSGPILKIVEELSPETINESDIKRSYFEIPRDMKSTFENPEIETALKHRGVGEFVIVELPPEVVANYMELQPRVKGTVSFPLWALKSLPIQSQSEYRPTLDSDQLDASLFCVVEGESFPFPRLLSSDEDLTEDRLEVLSAAGNKLEKSKFLPIAKNDGQYCYLARDRDEDHLVFETSNERTNGFFAAPVSTHLADQLLTSAGQVRFVEIEIEDELIFLLELTGERQAKYLAENRRTLPIWALLDGTSKEIQLFEAPIDWTSGESPKFGYINLQKLKELPQLIRSLVANSEFSPMLPVLAGESEELLKIFSFVNTSLENGTSRLIRIDTKTGTDNTHNWAINQSLNDALAEGTKSVAVFQNSATGLFGSPSMLIKSATPHEPIEQGRLPFWILTNKGTINPFVAAPPYGDESTEYCKIHRKRFSETLFDFATLKEKLPFVESIVEYAIEHWEIQLWPMALRASSDGVNPAWKMITCSSFEDSKNLVLFQEQDSDGSSRATSRVACVLPPSLEGVLKQKQAFEQVVDLSVSSVATGYQAIWLNHLESGRSLWQSDDNEAQVMQCMNEFAGQRIYPLWLNNSDSGRQVQVFGHESLPGKLTASHAKTSPELTDELINHQATIDFVEKELLGDEELDKDRVLYLFNPTSNELPSEEQVALIGTNRELLLRSGSKSRVLHLNSQVNLSGFLLSFETGNRNEENRQLLDDFLHEVRQLLEPGNQQTILLAGQPLPQTATDTARVETASSTAGLFGYLIGPQSNANSGTSLNDSWIIGYVRPESYRVIIASQTGAEVSSRIRQDLDDLPDDLRDRFSEVFGSPLPNEQSIHFAITEIAKDALRYQVEAAEDRDGEAELKWQWDPTQLFGIHN